MLRFSARRSRTRSPRCCTGLRYARLGLTSWSYEAIEIDEAALPAFLGGLDASWAGLSLTMPLKRAVIPLLDSVGETALSVDAVNTVLFAPDGSRRGENTDVPGLVAALHERGIHRVPRRRCSAAVRRRRPRWPRSPRSSKGT